MNSSAPNSNEAGLQNGAVGTFTPGVNEIDVLTSEISDEALESSSGIENRPMSLLPCTAARSDLRPGYAVVL
jgi:hypothetical protein